MSGCFARMLFVPTIWGRLALTGKQKVMEEITPITGTEFKMAA